MRSGVSGPLLVAIIFVALAACGKSTPSGGAGGGGGTMSFSGSAKPSCETPNDPSGGTPDARADTAGVLGADGRTFVMFGGDTDVPVCGANPTHTHVGDTWLLDAACGTWKAIAPATSPSPRARHAMALDAARDRAILFGGRTREGSATEYTLFDDVWAFDFATSAWSEITTSGVGPSARANAAIAVVGDRLVVFGGSTSTSGITFTPTNDVFTLDLVSGAWTKISPGGALPPARLFHAMAADPSANVVYVHAGGDANAFVGPFFSDTWALDLDAMTWSDVGATNGGEGTGRIKLGLAAAATAGTTALFAFAGHDDGTIGNRNDVLSLDPHAASPAWTAVRKGDVAGTPAAGACTFPPDFTIEDMASPERRSAFAFGARSDGKAFVVFGGDSDCGRLSDAWWFDTAAGTWTAIRQTLVGLTCERTGSTTCTGLCG